MNSYIEALYESMLPRVLDDIKKNGFALISLRFSSDEQIKYQLLDKFIDEGFNAEFKNETVNLEVKNEYLLIKK
ncbi:hypothetical protein [Acinetobacter baumannii]|uniref:Uncharacterized protein n=1 Tax=Acinetobacter baumannii TaxID=470 RepID=A0AAX0TXW9_ACIBA|nr:hypothetical protein [Acinetobacter baumannii]MDP7784613.1 hypothetical protein [Acinetobacter baumannii]PHQ04296.1 hypothetical protein CPI82_00265 [Acinetobacter baumannii]